MGGSLALAIKRHGLASNVTGWSRRESTLQQALSLGVVDCYEVDLSLALKHADCVVVATPTQFAESLILEVLSQVNDDVIVTDVASVKGNLVKVLERRFGRVPSNVVLGHPICGSEQSGVSAARADLYQNQRVVLASNEGTSEKALAAITKLWRELGAELFFMTAAEHDKILALTSHLPHTLAYALVVQLLHEDVDDVFRFAGGGFRDFTRIAGSDPRMWREIIFANDKQLLMALTNFEQKIAEFKQLITDGDSASLEELFAEAKVARDNYVENYTNSYAEQTLKD